MLECSYMPLSQFIRINFWFLFILLQCMAPLAHAHVDGHNAGQSAHIAHIDVAGALEHRHELEIAQMTSEEHLGAVVHMPPEYRLSVLIFDFPVLQNQACLLPKNEPASRNFDDLYQATLASTPYRHPFSQAPPL